MIKQLFNNFKLKKNKKITGLNRIITSMVLLISLLTGAFDAYAQSTHDVRVIIDGYWKAFRTGDITVEELFENNDINLHEKDIVSVSLDYLITDNIHIYIDTVETVIFKIQGEEPQTFITNTSTIHSALKEFQEETGRSFALKEGQSPAKEVTDNMVIELIPYVEEIVTKTEAIPFTTTYVENPDLALGKENIKTAGVDGVKELQIKEIYLDGELTSSSVISETIIQESVAQVIEKGTKENVIQTSAGTFSYSNVISMKATAYTAGYESTGKNPGDPGYGITASGMKARRGVVAVDTKVIPFGTELYIEGYGYAIAGDTGGAIKGNKIDVFVDTYSEAMNWGVRTVNVYILE